MYQKNPSLMGFYSLFVCCLSEGNKCKAKALNKWNYSTSAVQSNCCSPSQLLSPHTYLAHISSAPWPIYKFDTFFISSFSSHALLYMQKGSGCFILREMWLGRVGWGEAEPWMTCGAQRHQERYRGRVLERGSGSYWLPSQCLDPGINIQTQEWGMS